MTLNTLLKVRLFDDRWSNTDGFSARMPLGQPNDTHRRFLDEANTPAPAGFYALVRQGDSSLSAAVDRVRSIPLFYGTAPDGGLRLSDRAEWVRAELGAHSVLTGARDDFLLAGYVTGANTLFEGVKQLQAGERLDARIRGHRMEMKVSDYFVFKRTYDNRGSDNELEDELDTALKQTVGRLVQLAGGRQIAVPLSGGNDSRVIAMYLASMCPDQVVTFAYGLPDLGEVEVSRSVAAALGLKWHFVEGTEKFWSDLRADPGVRQYLADSHQYSSAPYMQDWPAVRQLISVGAIEPDAVIAPGHSGDVPTGGMMLPGLVSASSGSTVEEAIRQFHYVLWAYELLDVRAADLETWIRATSIPEEWGASDGRLQAVSAADCWNWRERQSKWLVNSMRGVESAGATWWMPLWDTEFVEFWMGAPFGALRDRRLYRQFVERKFLSMAGAAVPTYASATPGRTRHIATARRLIPASVLPIARQFYRRLIPRSPGFGRMGWEQWVDPHTLRSLGESGSNITSFAALETLVEIAKEFPDVVPVRFAGRLHAATSSGTRTP